MADVVFIVGAGASVHAGAPVMSNFIDVARDLLAGGQVNDRKKEFETAFKVISHLQRVHSKARLDHNNVEAVFAAVDLARTLGKLPGFESGEIDNARKSLVWMIVRTLEESIKIETVGGHFTGTNEYKQMARLIAELEGREPKLSCAVLTFNYDVAMDLTFCVEGLRFTYGLTPGQGGLPLLKLHGSLNWMRTRDGDRIIVPFDMQTYQKEVRLQWFGGDRKRQDVTTHVTKNCVELLKRQEIAVEDEPLLIPPTWSKGEYYRDIANVWGRAARELEEAKYIFVLGYSLPETDQFFRSLFALGTEGPTILNRIAIFDPNSGPVEQRFRAMLGQAALDRFSAHNMLFESGLVQIDNWLFQTGKRRAR
jgi:hypothetical protein